MKTKPFIIYGSISLFLFMTPLAYSAEPINKHIVDKALIEEPVPMPHLDSNNPEVIKLREDPARDMWRQKRDYSKDPKRTPGPISLQRYEAQLENIGVKTFFQRSFAWTQEDLQAGNVDVAIFGAPTGALPYSNGSMWALAEIRYTRDYGTYGASLP